LGDLKALTAAAHRLNMRVMLDAVFNHAGETHPFWLDLLKNQEHSPYRDYFHIRRFPVRHPESSAISPLRLPDARDLDFHAFAWSPRMPKWNTENPAVRTYLLDAAVYWIRECDIDGWRLDVANEVSFDFWKEFSRLVRAEKNDLYILGEIWHDSSNWINSGLFDAVMNYPLEYAVSDCFLRKTITPDVFTRRLVSSLTRYSDLHNRLSFNLLDSHDTDRALTRAGGDKGALKNAFTMLFLLPGSPCLYYGTETGMEGGGDPDCRRPMIWDEKRQDQDLRSFFQNLIKFRKEFLPIINHCVVQYRKTDEAHYWEFSGFGESLIAVYSEEPVRGFQAPGTCVSGPPDGNGELPPHTMLVYHRRES
jgi:glycosidase